MNLAHLVDEADDLEQRLESAEGKEREQIAMRLAEVAVKIERTKARMRLAKEVGALRSRHLAGDRVIEGEFFDALRALGRWSELRAITEAEIREMDEGGPEAWNPSRARMLCRAHNQAVDQAGGAKS